MPLIEIEIEMKEAGRALDSRSLKKIIRKLAADLQEIFKECVDLLIQPLNLLMLLMLLRLRTIRP